MNPVLTNGDVWFGLEQLAARLGLREITQFLSYSGIKESSRSEVHDANLDVSSWAVGRTSAFRARYGGTLRRG